MTLTLLSLIIFMAYLAIIIAYFGIPDSLSESYYLLEGKFKNSGVLFTLLMFVMVFLIIAPMLDSTPDKFQALAFFAILGLGFVGAAPLFKREGTESKVHFIAAAVSALCGMIWIFVVFPTLFYVPIAVAVTVLTLAALTKTTTKAFLFWAEMVVFFSVYVVLLLQQIVV